MTDPISTFSGLASGIDFRSLVDQIIVAESAPLRRVDDQIAEIGRRSSAWTTFRTLTDTFESAAETLRTGNVFEARRTAVSNTSLVNSRVSLGADIGSRAVRVLQTATAERVASADFASRSDALGLSGSFVVSGQTVTVEGSDALEDVARKIDDAFLSASDGGVGASVLQVATDRFRLILTADQTGAEGIDLVDPDGLLRDLGFLDDQVTTKNATTSGARSDAFDSPSLDAATLLGLQSGPSGTVTLGGVAVALDLDTMSLDDVAAAINTAAAGAGSSVSADVVDETVDGAVSFRLEISGTTSFVDDGRVLETLGILEGGRSAVAQRVESGTALQQSDGSTPAVASTLLTDLASGGTGSGVQVGDTLDIAGTRGDGTTFSVEFTVGASDTVQTLLDRLNDATDAFGAGARTATASIDTAGRLVVEDGTTGDSRLALSVVANNEGGGTLDLGSFGIAESGRARQIQAGTNAQLEVDGVFVERDENVVSDVIDGVTLTLEDADPDEIVTVDVEFDSKDATEAMKDLVDGYNALVEFVAGQSGSDRDGPLGGDATLRTMLANLRRTMQTQLGGTVAGGLTRLGELGIEIQQDGTFSFSSGDFREALEARPDAMRRLLGTSGSASTSAIEFVSATNATEPGTWEIEVTQAATRGAVTGTGFAGTYVDDGTPDTLSIRDIGGGATYDVELSNGMTMSEIVSAIEEELGTPQALRLEATNAFESDALGTVATRDTLLSDVFFGGVGAGITTGDRISIGGRGADGTAFFAEFEVTDAASQTLGDLVDEVQGALGDGFAVSIDDSGRLTAESRTTGSNLAELTVTSDNAGGGSFDLGGVTTARAGRTAARIEVSEVGGQLSLRHLDYGSSTGVEISWAAGGTDGSASLGLAAGTYTGLDVAGTIGGVAATGTGRLLTGDDGTAVEGLTFRVDGDLSGVVGDLTFSRGIASLVELAAEPLLGSEQGSIQSIIDQGDARVESLNNRLDFLEERLTRRRANLIDRFVAVEEALAQGQQQISFLLSQLGQAAPQQDS